VELSDEKLLPLVENYVVSQGISVDFSDKASIGSANERMNEFVTKLAAEASSD
jgi:hypothetical protein